jgi:hypothetical protein
MVSRQSNGFQFSFDGKEKRIFSKVDFLAVWTGVYEMGGIEISDNK